MGYSYGRNERGHWVLSCDNCGNTGGVRKRECPHMVRGDSLHSRGGHRHEMHYCPAPAVCGPCYAQLGGRDGIHGEDCRNGAAASTAKYDVIEAGLDAGEMYVIVASGDWAKHVPAGMVEVTFRGRGGEVKQLVPEGDYHPGTKPRLSDYALAVVAA